MKSAKEIISHIKTDPLYTSFTDRADFLNLFSATHKSLIAFIYIKENILMIALKHPLGKVELKKDSNINLIKDLLKMFVKFRPNSEFASVKDIKFFVADRFMAKKYKFKNPNLSEKKEILPYSEKSKGKFKNDIKDEKIHAIFEEIRGLILANRRD